MKCQQLVLTLCLSFALIGCNVEGGNDDETSGGGGNGSSSDSSNGGNSDGDNGDTVGPPSESTSLAQQDFLEASDPAPLSGFGHSITLEGDTLAVLARGRQAAYVLTRSGGGWSEKAILEASNARQNEFPGSIALDDDTLVIGAPQEGPRRFGAAYVFTRNGDVWSQQAYLKASDVVGYSEFGSSVALQDDTLVVGAPGLAEAAYVFTRNGGVWREQAILKASNAGSSGKFGYSVVLDGDTLVVGAIREAGDASSTAASPNDNAEYAGAAYVFTRTSGAWVEQAYLKASNAASDDRFGTSLALDGDTLVVGANRKYTAGAAYVYTRSGGAWSEQAELKASNAGVRDGFGASVALDGETLMVGAPLKERISPRADGTVSVYSLSRGIWSEQDELTASNASFHDGFGSSVVLDDNNLMVGAPGHAGLAPGGRGSGAVYVFR